MKPFIHIREDGCVNIGQSIWYTRGNEDSEGCLIAEEANETLVAHPEKERFEVNADGGCVFIYVDGHEVIFWDCSDTSHTFQGAEIAESLKVISELEVDAFLRYEQGRRWPDGPREWSDRIKFEEFT